MRGPIRPSGGALAALAVLAAALAACAPRETPEARLPPAPTLESPPPVIDQVPPSVSTRADRFCADLQRIVDAKAQGFASLRGEAVGPRAWAGTVIPEGFRSCSVEGQSHPGAEYVCLGSAVAPGNGVQLDRAFDAVASELEACFARPAWFPRNWERGQVIEFAGLERQQLWRDLAPMPKPGVTLKIEEDFRNRVYFLRLAVFTLR